MPFEPSGSAGLTRWSKAETRRAASSTAARPITAPENRAKGFTAYVEALAALPGCVGFHWFECRDEPKEGRRLDGENSNYGVVKIDFTPWEVLTTRMKQVNAGIESLHAKAGSR
jgi:hypothetical protein